MIKLGFTGTQVGMTPAQRLVFATLLRELGVTELHHGDCIGADEQAHTIALADNISIIVHPPHNSSKRAFCRGAKDIHPTKPYLERNHDIVDETGALIATPKEKEEQLRSGTWATYRYATKQKKRTIIIYPDGTYVDNAREH
jgi:hypothetical protein